MADQDNRKTSAARPPRRSPRRSTALIAVLAMAAAGGGAWLAASSAADYFERRLATDARAALDAANLSWAEVSTDGTQVHIAGTAPDEVARFRALTAVSRATEAGRVIDDMQVEALASMQIPEFEVELLRNDDGISIIGLVPAGLDRASVVEGLQKRTGLQNIADLLETADYEVPAHWDEAFAFGLRAAQLAPRAKISIEAGRVTVRAITDSRDQRIALEDALRRNKPATVALTTDITAPRPVISPFTLRFVMDGDGARFDACAADTELARDEITAAGRRAGIPGQPGCQLGLGAPSRDWGRAAALGIDAVAALGAGSVTLSDTDVALQVPASVEQQPFDETVARLETALPAPFTLTARKDEAQDGMQGPVEFSATVTGPDQVTLRGRIGDARMRDTVETIARSRFGQVDSALRLDSDAPSGWTVSVVAGIEALAGLERGSVTVTPDLIRLSGTSGNQTASDIAAMTLAERLGAGANYELAIRYDRRLDPLLALPSGEECVDRLNTVMRESLIGFEPNKSTIAGDPEPTLALLADAMTDCDEYRIEVGGHTDSQGSESFNADLSHKRAQAILDAMTGAGIATRLMDSHGYGESEPIADNGTEAGREANRRIEFRLKDERPVALTPVAPAQTVTGTTTEEQVTDAQDQPQVDPAELTRHSIATIAVRRILGAGATDVGMSAPVLVIGPGRAPDAAGDDAAQDDLATHALMIATIIVNELAASPEVAIDISEELGDDSEPATRHTPVTNGPAADTDARDLSADDAAPGSEAEDGDGDGDDDGAPAAAATGDLDPQARFVATTTALAVTGLGVTVQTPDDDTPRPSRRPDN